MQFAVVFEFHHANKSEIPASTTAYCRDGEARAGPAGARAGPACRAAEQQLCVPGSASDRSEVFFACWALRMARSSRQQARPGAGPPPAGIYIHPLFTRLRTGFMLPDTTDLKIRIFY